MFEVETTSISVLHCVSLGEKHQVLENLWRKHTDEMEMLEGNVITIGGKQWSSNQVLTCHGKAGPTMS